jgi:hypothetical protein
VRKLSSRSFCGEPDKKHDKGGIVLVLDSGQDLETETLASVELDPRLDLQNHSPTGFAWGYTGSGPAQLALAILAEVGQDDALAIDLHQGFKHDVIARLPDATWSISEEYVRGWIEAMIARPLYLQEDQPNIVDQDEPGYKTEPDMLADEQLDPVLVLELSKMGYSDIKHVVGFGVCGILRFMYTVGVCHGLDMHGLKGRFCFNSMQNAQLFLKDWDGTTSPTVGDDGCTAIK